MVCAVRYMMSVQVCGCYTSAKVQVKTTSLERSRNDDTLTLIEIALVVSDCEMALRCVDQTRDASGDHTLVVCIQVLHTPIHSLLSSSASSMFFLSYHLRYSLSSNAFFCHVGTWQ